MQSGKRMGFAFRLVAVLFVALGLTAGIVYAVKSFHVGYNVAYSTSGRGGAGLLQAIAQANKDEKTWIRFDRIPFPSLEEAAKALETGKADIALVRPDVALPAKAATIGILRREAVFLITPPKSPIEVLQGAEGQERRTAVEAACRRDAARRSAGSLFRAARLGPAYENAGRRRAGCGPAEEGRCGVHGRVPGEARSPPRSFRPSPRRRKRRPTSSASATPRASPSVCPISARSRSLRASFPARRPGRRKRSRRSPSPII